MSDVTLQERLDSATEDLGNCGTADDVAEILRREKVSGRRGEACDCPLTNLLRKRLALSEDDTVETNGKVYIVIVPHESAETPMGTAARAFITRFDHHGFEEFAVPGSKCDDVGCEECFGPDVIAGNPPTAVTPNG